MLEGLKVIEYATYMAAPGAGCILSDWGAEVIKIEPPGGDPIRNFFRTIQCPPRWPYPVRHGP
jgi:crotonobetainyl-CoA:carnitine CoA-transferase CaiB-like acyl-CoA transferase